LKDRRHDSYLGALYAELRRHGIKVIDVTDELHDDRFDKRGASFPKGDVHWSPAAALTAAKHVHKELRRATPWKSLARDKTIVERTTTVDAAGESMKVRWVGTKSGEFIEPIQPTPGAVPIVVVGDANALVYHQAGWPARFDGRSPAGFADQLAFEFGTAVEVRAQPGMNWKRAPEQFRPGSSEAVKAVVWCLAASTFLEDSSAPAAARTRQPARQGPRPRTTPSGADSGGLRLRDETPLEMREQ
jgi:hypothetical protein